MFEQKTLLQDIQCHLSQNDPIQIPNYITSNIRYPLFHYQEDCLLHFLAYQQHIHQYNTPTHLLCNIATGGGKTLMMACMMLYYYKQGYRHFLFISNQKNILEKTKGNLAVSEYAYDKALFKDVYVDGKQVNISHVDYFDTNTDDMEIRITSIHKLHNEIHAARENSNSLEELQALNLVILADEAHHFNTITKKTNSTLDLLKNNASRDSINKSWEYTICEMLLRKNGASQNNNVLLELTATIPKHKQVVAKYADKVFYKYDMKRFMLDGYTKTVHLMSNNLAKRERMLLALLMNWYRVRLAEQHGINQFKPIILFRSKYVEMKTHPTDNIESDYHLFVETISQLNVKSFAFLKSLGYNKQRYVKGKNKLFDALHHLLGSKDGFQDLLVFAQARFDASNCIRTHSKLRYIKTKVGKEKTTAEQDAMLNSLEQPHNHITAVFTCKRLTEGWDVQNLYDIVMLYNNEKKTVSKSKKVAASTVSEVQLIGRGVRYYPFTYQDHLSRKRHFDEVAQKELQVLESFYYYCNNNRSYVAELKKEIAQKDIVLGEINVSKQLGKPKQKRKAHTKRKFRTFETYKAEEAIVVTFGKDEINIEDVLSEQTIDCIEEDNLVFRRFKTTVKDLFQEIPFVFLTAKNKTRKGSIYEFCYLKKYFPSIRSSKQLFSENAYLGNVNITIQGYLLIDDANDLMRFCHSTTARVKIMSAVLSYLNKLEERILNERVLLDAILT